MNKCIKDHDVDVDALKTQIEGYPVASVKTRIANKMGLPFEMAGGLSGENEKEIRKDAESFEGQIKGSFAGSLTRRRRKRSG